MASLRTAKAYLHVGGKHVEDLGCAADSLQDARVLDAFRGKTIRIVARIAVNVLRFMEDRPSRDHYHATIQ
jgi:hypothetical protein